MIYITLQADGTAPLFIASQKGHCDVVDLLLRNGANINQSDQVHVCRYNINKLHTITSFTTDWYITFVNS